MTDVIGLERLVVNTPTSAMQTKRVVRTGRCLKKGRVLRHHHGLNSRVSGNDQRGSKRAHITNPQIGLLERVVQPVGFYEILGMLQFPTISFSPFARDPQAGERW